MKTLIFKAQTVEDAQEQACKFLADTELVLINRTEFYDRIDEQYTISIAYYL